MQARVRMIEDGDPFARVLAGPLDRDQSERNLWNSRISSRPLNARSRVNSIQLILRPRNRHRDEAIGKNPPDCRIPLAHLAGGTRRLRIRRCLQVRDRMRRAALRLFRFAQDCQLSAEVFVFSGLERVDVSGASESPEIRMVEVPFEFTGRCGARRVHRRRHK